MFKKKFIIFIFLFSVLMVLGFINSDENYFSKSPRLVFKKETHNFGKVQSGDVLTYSFKFTNKGNGVLEIGNITTSCGCTGATVGDKTQYDKNESGEIKVTFNTQGRTGPQEKIIVVHSNDTKKPHKTLKVKCNIE